MEEASESLRKASNISPGNSKVLVMLGMHYAKVGALTEAITTLEAALKAASGYIPLDAYLTLGHLHSTCGNHAMARVRYLDACRSCPCCSTWLGAGISSYELGLLHDAEMCLSEANVLDNYRPAVWGYLALVSLSAGRKEESAEATRLAIQNGIKDARILAQLGDMCKSSGQVGEALRLYKLATVHGAESSVYIKLGETLVSSRDFKRARDSLLNAIELTQKEGNNEAKARASTLLAVCNEELGISM